MRTTTRIVIVAAVFLAATVIAPGEGRTERARNSPALFTGQQMTESAVRYEPSSPEIVKEMLEMAAVTGTDMVYDMGSGDGRILIAAARERGARGIGVDIDPELIRESRKNARRENVSDLVQFRQQDLFETNLESATVVMLYLSPSANLKLRPKLLRELRPGARIVSHSHDMGEWEPDRETIVQNHRVYSWVVPAYVSGTWKLELTNRQGALRYTVIFIQTFQRITAALQADGDEILLTDAHLQGGALQFGLEKQIGDISPPALFTAEVNGDVMQGKYRSASEQGTWAARRIR